MDCSRAKVHDPDEWLEAAAPFSAPIVAELREWIHRWSPDLSESVKWNCLAFSGKKLVCLLSACQRHAGITFFRGTELADPAGLFNFGEGNVAIRTIKITAIAGLDREAFRRLLHAAVELDLEPRLPGPPKAKREPVVVPPVLLKELKRNHRAQDFFQSLAPTYQREYITWISTAKRDETRAQRLTQTLAALANGRKWIDRKKA